MGKPSSTDKYDYQEILTCLKKIVRRARCCGYYYTISGEVVKEAEEIAKRYDDPPDSKSKER
jgi:hypothetical protein